MFQDLDSTLKKILDDPNAPAELVGAEVSFVTPARDYQPGQTTVNLFLHQVEENRKLRDPVPGRGWQGDSFTRDQPPLRVACHYLVTTWSDSSQVKEVKVAEEHRLLAQALQWLSRFPTIPDNFLQGNLAGQPFPPPTMVAQLDNKQTVGEFWTALGIPPRPSFGLTVSIALELGVHTPAGPPVVTHELRLKQKDIAGSSPEITFEIAGTIRDGAANPVADAQVFLQDLGWMTTTDTLGRFRFLSLSAGNYTLQASAAGFVDYSQPILVPGPTLNAYDVQLTAN